MSAIVGPELAILVIVLVIVLVWRGPSTLPRLGEAFGKAVKGVRESMAARSTNGSAGSGESTDSQPDAGHDGRRSGP